MVNSQTTPTRVANIPDVFACFRPMEKLPKIAPNGARVCLFPANPDLADILGRTDFEFDILFMDFDFAISFWILLDSIIFILGIFLEAPNLYPTCGYVAAGAFFQKKRPQNSGSP